MDFGSHSSHAVIFSLKRNAIPLSRILVSKNLYVQRNVLTEIYSMTSNPYIHHRTFDLQMMRLSRWVFWGAAWGVLWSRHTFLHNYLWNHVCWDWNSEHFEVLLWGSLKHMHSTSHPRYSWASYLFRSLSIGSTIPTLNYFLCTLLSPIRFLNSSS